MPTSLTLSVTEFKAKCLSLLEQIRTRDLKRLVVTKHGQPIAEVNAIQPSQTKGENGWNPLAALAGRIILPSGFDPAAPVYDPGLDGPLAGDEI